MRTLIALTAALSLSLAACAPQPVGSNAPDQVDPTDTPGRSEGLSTDEALILGAVAGAAMSSTSSSYGHRSYSSRSYSSPSYSRPSYSYRSYSSPSFSSRSFGGGFRR